MNDPEYPVEQDQQYQQDSFDQGKYSLGYVSTTMII